MVKFGNINADVNHERPPFNLYDTVISTNDYHRTLDRNKYSQAEPGQHPAINNSDKGNGNTLHKVVKATGKNQKSTVSECIMAHYRKRKESMVNSFLNNHTRTKWTLLNYLTLKAACREGNI